MSPNPLKHVFQIIGEEPEWITYDRWGSLLHDAVGVEDFYKKLEVCGGPDARSQWERLMRRVTPLGEANLRAAVGGGAYGWVGGAQDTYRIGN